MAAAPQGKLQHKEKSYISEYQNENLEKQFFTSNRDLQTDLPSFDGPLVDQCVVGGQTATYNLPQTTIPATIVNDMANPGWASLSGSVYTFSPTSFVQLQLYTLTIYLQSSSPQQQFTLRVKVQASCNSPPTFAAALTNQNVVVGKTINYKLPAFQDSDIADTVLIYSNIFPGYVSFNVDTYTISPTSNLDVGTLTVSLSISDGKSSPVPFSFDINVSPNSPPAFTSNLVYQSVTQGHSVTYTIPYIIDPDSVTVSVSTSSLPSFVTFSDPTFTFTPTTSISPGAYQITVTLNDGVNTPVSGIFNVNVVANTPPSFGNVPLVTQTVTQGQAKAYTLPVFVDPDLDAVTISQTLPAFVAFSIQTYIITPSNLFAGPYTINLQLSDGITSPQSFSFVINVISNTPPTFSTLPLTDQSVVQGHQKTYTLPSTFDADSDTVTISQDLFSFVTFSGSTYSINPSISDLGSYTVSITLSDSINPLQLFSFVINVIENTPPSFSSLPLTDQTVAQGHTITYTLPTTNDVDLDPVTISASGFPSFVSFFGATFTISPTLSHSGSYNILVTLNDGITAAVQESFIIQVDPNHPPTFSSPLINQSVIQGHSTTYTLPATFDEDSDPVSLIAAAPPNYVTVSGSTYTISPTTSILGIDSIEFTLNDGINQPVSFLLFIIVTPNHPPSFDASLVDQNVIQGHSLSFDLPQYSDIDQDAVTFTQSGLPSFAQFSAPTTYIIRPTLSNIGPFTVQITLRDGISAPAHFSFVIHVLKNNPPTFSSSLVDQNVIQGKILSYKLPQAFDADSDAVTITSQCPSFVQFDQNTFTISPLFSDIGLYKVSIQLNDGFNPEVLFSFNINVGVNSWFLNNIAGPIQNQGPPIFSGRFEHLTIKLHSNKTQQPTILDLPQIYDPDNDQYSVDFIIKEALKFTKATGPTQLTFSPSIQQTGNYEIQIILTDKHPFPKSMKYTLNVLVVSKLTKNNTSLSDQQSSSNKIVKKLVALKISQFTSSGQLKLKLSRKCAELASQMNNMTLSLNLFTKKQQPVTYTVINYSEFFIELQLQYEDPQSLSQSEEKDILEVIITQELKFQKGPELLYIPKDTTLRSSIRPYVDQSTLNLMSKFQDSGAYATYTLAIGNILISNFMASLLCFIWNALNEISFLVILALLSINIPGVARIVNSIILSFAYMDVFQTNEWLPKIIPIDDFDDYAINQYFDDCGFSSMNAVNNLGSTLIFLFIVLVSYLMLAIINILSAFSQRLRRIETWLKSKLIWNFVLRFLIQQYQSIAISRIIILTPLIMFLIVHNKRKFLKTKEFISQFGTLTETLNLDSQISIYWSSFLVLRWLLTITVLITLRDMGGLQIIVLFYMSIIWQILLIKVQPFEQRSANITSLINEFMVSLYLYGTFILTDLLNDFEIKNIAAFGLVVIVLVSYAFNILFMLRQIFSRICRRLFQLYQKKKVENIVQQQKINKIIEKNEIFVDSQENQKKDIFVDSQENYFNQEKTYFDKKYNMRSHSSNSIANQDSRINNTSFSEALFLPDPTYSNTLINQSYKQKVFQNLKKDFSSIGKSQVKTHKQKIEEQKKRQKQLKVKIQQNQAN